MWLLHRTCQIRVNTTLKFNTKQNWTDQINHLDHSQLCHQMIHLLPPALNQYNISDLVVVTTKWLSLCGCRSACVQGREREALLQIGLLLRAQAEAELQGGRPGLQTGRRPAAERGVGVGAEAGGAAHHRAPTHRRRLLDRSPEESGRDGQQLGMCQTVLLDRRKQVHI